MNMFTKALNVLLQEGPKPLFYKVKYKYVLRMQYKKYLSALKKYDDSVDVKRKVIKSFRNKPIFSIAVPVFNTDEKWLRLCIESVMNQVYGRWELCLVDGGSSKGCVREVLEEYSNKDGRINVKFLSQNKGIAGNSNEALSLATGDFIALLDHDDELAPDALYEIVKLLNDVPDADMIYTDEDKITPAGKRLDPHFKPDWSPDYLNACNYICHFTVIRKEIIDEIGGFRSDYDGSQDYDLFLRATECAQKIGHIPKVLYHWRIIPESAAGSSAAKPYAYEAAKKALSDAVHRRGGRADILDGYGMGTYRVKYYIKEAKKVTIIIPSNNEIDLQKCVQSLISKTTYDNYEVLVVVEPPLKTKVMDLYNEPEMGLDIRVVDYNGPWDFTKIANYAVSLTNSEYIVFLDSHAEIISGEWLSALVEHIQRNSVGIVGSLLYYPNNKVQHSGIIVGINGSAGYMHRNFSSESRGYTNRIVTIQNVSAVSRACMMIKRSVFDAVGGFNESFQSAFSDIDLCLKVRGKGYLIVYTPYAKLYLHKSDSMTSRKTDEQQFRLDVDIFRRKWADFIEKGDPYYNPNLTLSKEDFSIKQI